MVICGLELSGQPVQLIEQRFAYFSRSVFEKATHSSLILGKGVEYQQIKSEITNRHSEIDSGFHLGKSFFEGLGR